MRNTTTLETALEANWLHQIHYRLKVEYLTPFYNCVSEYAVASYCMHNVVNHVLKCLHYAFMHCLETGYCVECATMSLIGIAGLGLCCDKIR